MAITNNNSYNYKAVKSCMVVLSKAVQYACYPLSLNFVKAVAFQCKSVNATVYGTIELSAGNEVHNAVRISLLFAIRFLQVLLVFATLSYISEAGVNSVFLVIL